MSLNQISLNSLIKFAAGRTRSRNSRPIAVQHGERINNPNTVNIRPVPRAVQPIGGSIPPGYNPNVLSVVQAHTGTGNIHTNAPFNTLENIRQVAAWLMPRGKQVDGVSYQRKPAFVSTASPAPVQLITPRSPSRYVPDHVPTGGGSSLEAYLPNTPASTGNNGFIPVNRQQSTRAATSGQIPGLQRVNDWGRGAAAGAGLGAGAMWLNDLLNKK